MNFFKKYPLRKEQAALLEKRRIFERLQTLHSEDMDFCHYMQAEMDNLDTQVEQIRCILEGRD